MHGTGCLGGYSPSDDCQLLSQLLNSSLAFAVAITDETEKPEEQLDIEDEAALSKLLKILYCTVDDVQGIS